MQASFGSEKIPLDSSRLSITFEVRALELWRIGGRFEQVWGDLTLDRNEARRSQLRVVASTSSIRTGSKQVDHELKSAGFFDAEHFPVVNFESTTITLTHDQTGLVTGNLSMRGITRAVSFQFRFHDIVAEGALQARGRIEASGTIRRSQWGMSAFIPVVSDDVHLHISVKVGN